MTKAQIKFIQSLGRQKYRKEHNLYLVEGDKNAQEWLRSGASIRYIAALPGWLTLHRALTAAHPEAEVLVAEAFELEKISSLQHAQQVLLVAEQHTPVPFVPLEGSWHLYLEKIQDPGNMGTIIRTADWFGITQVLCSPGCADVYNPKVVQASMGSLLRVAVTVLEPGDLLAVNTLPLYAASLHGSDMKASGPHRGGVIALGNESQGLSELLLQKADHALMIPRLGEAESLNVSVAAGILCAELLLSGREK